MRKSIITLFLLASVAAYGQSKLDLGSQARLRTPAVTRASDGHLRVAPHTDTLRGFITLSPGSTATDLEAMGVIVRSSRGAAVIAEFDRSLLPALETSAAVSAINLEKPVTPKLDRARAVTGIDKIHAGTDLPRAYTGRGVVAGIVDGGFDPNHLNFKNSDGSPRIQSFCYYRPTQTGERVEQILTADELHVVDTEDGDNFHGTHTLGIMAGGYRGKISASVADGGNQSLAEIDNPYYGVATESEIAVASGASSDYYVALGIETILNYAYYKKQPAVINLSLGSNVGPHDGSSALCRYIDQISEQDRVVVCMAAGNEGALPICLSKTFSASDKDPLLTCFDLPQPVDEFPNVRAGQTYIYSDNDRSFVVQAVAINRSRGRVAFRMPLGETEGTMKYWVTSAEYKQTDDDIVSPQLGKWFCGYVGVGAMTDEASGRYYAIIDCMLWDNTEGNPDGNYLLGIQVDGNPGQRIDLYGDAQFNQFSSFGLPGFSDGTTDGTISDLATGRNTVVVGAYNTRERWASVDNNIYGYEPGMVPEGEMTYFTSYGTLTDGRTLPHVCAPGVALISSTNEYYLEENYVPDRELQATASDGSRRYSWQYCAGTSMATPVVSGAIALWLEADPELTAAEVIDIIAKTSVKDDAVATTGNPVQWGAGKFDAYAGLKEVLARSTGICSPVADSSRPMVTRLGDNRFEIFLAGAKNISATLYNLQGIEVAAIRSDGSQALLDASSVRPGIYILSINNTSLRIAIK